MLITNRRKLSSQGRPASPSKEDQGVIVDLIGKVCYNSRNYLAPHFSTARRFNFQLLFTRAFLNSSICDIPAVLELAASGH